MSFTTLEFAVFVSVVFLLYWFAFSKSIKQQNVLILLASYAFYGWWDWRFLALIFISSMVDFLVGLGLEKTEDNRERKALLYVSLATNLGILFLFKYFNFFLATFKTLFSIHSSQFQAINVILPVGISFYTLQTLSYTIDVFDKRTDTHRDLVSFFAYVSFFPQLVAGPIERAANLLPQFRKERTFSYVKAADGMRQILWGLFKKLFVADHCGLYVDEVFTSFGHHQGSTLFLALVLLSIQVYCDFSGYSDMAIGSAKLFGFNLSKNFDYPFFSRNMSEFWKKWHITLIEWFRFYIVRKLKGFSKHKITRNTFAVFIISGLWHGANYTFILWGLLHAIAFLPLIYGKRKKNKQVVANGKLFPSIKESYHMTKTFLTFVVIGVFFRIDSVGHGFSYLKQTLSFSFFKSPYLPNRSVGVGIVILFTIEWLQRNKNHGLVMDAEKINPVVRWGGYFALILLILFFAAPKNEFIYFQF